MSWAHCLKVLGDIGVYVVDALICHLGNWNHVIFIYFFIHSFLPLLIHLFAD